MHEIRINADGRIRVQGGISLLEALTRERIFVPSACGGRAACGTCKVTVREGADPILPAEEPHLDEEERERGVRLSCQVRVQNDLHIEIPEELLSVRQYRCTCVGIREMTYDTRQFRLGLEDPDRMNFIPGQYVQILAPKYEEGTEEVLRAYSLSSDSRDEGFIELIIRRVPNGICTTYLFDFLKAGDPVLIKGPYGQFRLSDSDAPMVLIAGGSGMAPIKCMLHHMVNTKCNRSVTFFFGVNTLRDLYMVEEMEVFEARLSGFRFVPVVARPEEGADWKGRTGLVTQSLAEYSGDFSSFEAYICGSPGMIEATLAVLTSRGMPLEQVFYDKFS